MIDQHRVLAVILARGGSKGLPRKNVRPLGGKPLVAWPITAALGARCVDRVIVSTDDAEIAQAASAAGADIPFMRPSELANDTASSLDAVRHAVETLAREGDHYGYIILLEPTSPLTESSDVDRALELLVASRREADAIVGISQVEATHPQFNVRYAENGLIQPYIASNFRSLPRRQDLEPLYFLEGSLYASDTAAFLKFGTFCHERTLGYPVPRWKSIEIDDLIDLVCAEAILAIRKALKAHESTPFLA